MTRMLIGASSHTIDLGTARVTYHKGEEVPEEHYQLVPSSDRRLFRKVKAEAAAKDTTRSAKADA
ncbi:MAG: hypothetical protein AAGI52_06645 [Bacteroidota bacterium]